MTEFEKELLEMLKAERRRCDVLLDAVLRFSGAIEQTVQIPPAPNVSTDVEWEERRRRLETKFKKVKDPEPEQEHYGAE
jgi:hypothetical protein